MIAKQINEQINKANNILLVTHQNPDGDALGSICALAIYLEKIGKPYQIFDFGVVPPYFYFLPGLYRLQQNITGQPANYDLIIVLDCGDLKLTGLPAKFRQNIFLINIDHHFSNADYGDLNLVDKSATSTTEVLTNFLKQTDIEIDKNLATCLLTGIVNDSNNFTNPATRLSSFQLAAYLMGKGAKLSEITNNSFNNKSLNALRFWGRALMRLKNNESLGLLNVVVSRQDLKLYDISEQDMEGLTDFLISSSSGRAVLVLRELPGGQIRGSLRSISDSIDVSKLAKVLGGGGHKKAAGFTINGRLKQNQSGWEVV